MRRSHLDRAASLLLSSVLAASVTISSMPLSVFAEGKTENESAVAASSSSGEAAEEAASAISEDAGESETANDAAASPDFDAAALESSDNCYQIGYKAHGFTLTDIGYDKSVAALKLVFTHDNTGAQIVFMLNDDQNRAFGTVFQTAPTDDTGKLHILEHASCAACDKYPGNDVFFDITNNCYITDINAMTGDNATSYYVTSLDAKQLAAVTDFYMNCAFHSAILTDENYFKREGWRYELSDKNADLTVNGIVLNEMKGAATINQETMNDIQKTLFPDTPEQYCAGGIPSDITDLTYEDLIAFYKQAYQPSNCSTLFYGDINVDYYLQVFNDDYFAGYSKTDTKSGATQEQQPFDAPVSASFDYPVSEDTEDTGSTIAYTVAMPSDLGYINERTLSMAVSLMGDNSSELMTALNESGIGSSYGVEDTYFGPQYGILFYAAGADPSKKDDFKKIVLDSVSKMAGDGLNQDMIDNVYRGIKRSEDLARNNSDVGAQLVDKYMSSVNDNRPEELDPTDSYQQAYLQARSGACEKLMQSEIVDNNLAALVTVTPKPGLLEQNEEAEQKKLADIKGGHER
jgi:Zn-dependent M16 (insulinase) family peptidase